MKKSILGFSLAITALFCGCSDCCKTEKPLVNPANIPADADVIGYMVFADNETPLTKANLAALGENAPKDNALIDYKSVELIDPKLTPVVKAFNFEKDKFAISSVTYAVKARSSELDAIDFLAEVSGSFDAQKVYTELVTFVTSKLDSDIAFAKETDSTSTFTITEDGKSLKFKFVALPGTLRITAGKYSEVFTPMAATESFIKELPQNRNFASIKFLVPDLQKTMTTLEVPQIKSEDPSDAMLIAARGLKDVSMIVSETAEMLNTIVTATASTADSANLITTTLTGWKGMAAMFIPQDGSVRNKLAVELVNNINFTAVAEKITIAFPLNAEMLARFSSYANEIRDAVKKSGKSPFGIDEDDDETDDDGCEDGKCSGGNIDPSKLVTE